MKRQKMLLITHDFPYGESEHSFLSSEVSELEKHYELTILAVLYQGSDTELKYPVSGNYSFSSFKNTSYRSGLFRLLTDKADRHELSAAFSKGAQAIKFTVGWLCRSYAAEKEIDKLIEKQGCDILYTYWCTEETAAAIRLKKKHPEMRVISRLHGYDLFRERNPYGLQPMHEQIADQADLLVFVSRNGQQYFKKQFPGKAPTMLSYLGAEGFGLLPKQKRPSHVVVSCSNTVPLKRIQRIADALSLVEGICLKWLHIGGGSELEQTKAYAEKKLEGSSCTVQFAGNIPNADVAELYRRYLPDLFITASESEGLPVSIMEACSCGIPTVATAVGGIPEIVSDGENGYLVSEEAKAQDIADAVARFYSLPFPEQLKMREKAFQTFESTFDARVNAESFIKQLQQRLDAE